MNMHMILLAASACDAKLSVIAQNYMLKVVSKFSLLCATLLLPLAVVIPNGCSESWVRGLLAIVELVTATVCDRHRSGSGALLLLAKQLHICCRTLALFTLLALEFKLRFDALGVTTNFCATWHTNLRFTGCDDTL